MGQDFTEKSRVNSGHVKSEIFIRLPSIEEVSILLKISQNTEEDETLINSSYETNITLTSKPDKDNVRTL